MLSLSVVTYAPRCHFEFMFRLHFKIYTNGDLIDSIMQLSITPYEHAVFVVILVVVAMLILDSGLNF